MKGLNIWDNEPNLLQFTVHGFMCKIERISGLGHLCGYIMVEDTHPWYAKDCNELSDVAVHGGLTYRGLFPTYSWLGFDCAHVGDLIPQMPPFGDNDNLFTDGDLYRDMGYVVNELIKLANQAKEVQE
jgi:hypothetical protein